MIDHITIDYTDTRMRTSVAVQYLPTGDIFGTFSTHDAAHEWLDAYTDPDTADWRVIMVHPPRPTPAQEREGRLLVGALAVVVAITVVAIITIAIYLTVTGGWDDGSLPPPI